MITIMVSYYSYDFIVCLAETISMDDPSIGDPVTGHVETTVTDAAAVATVNYISLFALSTQLYPILMQL